MGKFSQKQGKESPGISTSSMPDIVFILLFFFMVATVMKEVTLKVQNKLPKATELQKAANRSLLSYIYVGKPTPQYQKEKGTADAIQLNDAFATPGDIGAFVAAEKGAIPEGSATEDYRVVIKADGSTKVGIKTDVTQELRKVHQLKIMYAATDRGTVY